MPRATKIVPQSVPADVLLTLARDPDAFADQLIDWDKRRQAAIKAEQDAAEKLKAVEASVASMTAKEAALIKKAKEVEDRQTLVSDQTAKAHAQMDARKAQLDAMIVDIDARKAALDSQARDTRDRAREYDRLNDELAKREAGLQKAKDDILARENALADREGKFRNRIKALNEGM